MLQFKSLEGSNFHFNTTVSFLFHGLFFFSSLHERIHHFFHFFNSKGLTWSCLCNIVKQISPSKKSLLEIVQ